MRTKKENYNGVKSKKLIKLSEDIWDLGDGWVNGTQFSAKGTRNGQEFDELLVGFTDINRDEYLIMFNDHYATVTLVFERFENGEDKSWVEELDGKYTWESVLQYISNLPKPFTKLLKEYKGKCHICQANSTN